MKVELEKAFPMPAAPEAAWAFLQDIEGVAGCMPGAKITERIDATHFKGTVSVKVGPASMAFRGDIEVRELDAAQRMLHLVGKGSDTSGSSGASMDLVARIEPNAADGLSQLIGRSEVTMSGKAAAFGGRMMGTVADQILKQFAGNFATQVQARAANAPAAANTPVAPTPGAAESAAANARQTSADAPSAARATEATANTSAGATRAPEATAYASAGATRAPEATANASAEAARSPQPPTLQPATAPNATAPANELNALALLWAIIRDWFRGLFRRRPA